MIENFPSNYFPDQFVEQSSAFGSQTKQEEIKCLNPGDFEITDYAAIPSSVSLLKAEASNQEDINEFRSRRKAQQAQNLKSFKEDLKESTPDAKEPEAHLKAMLPSFTAADLDQNKSKQFPLDYEEAVYYGESKYAVMARYYLGLERISTLEWFINKLQFRTDEVVHLENAIQNGLPFWREDEFDQRMMSTLDKSEVQSGFNERSQEFWYSKVVGLRNKRNLAEEVTSFSQILKSLIAEYQRTKPEQKADYLQSYCEFRYLQIIGGFHKLVEQFYLQKNIPAVRACQQSIAEVTKMDHVRVTFHTKSNYHVSTALTHHQNQQLESGNIFAGANQPDAAQSFRRSIQPVINEKALEPPQVNLFQSIY